MSYGQQLIVARALTIVVGGITLIQAGSADTLGISLRTLAWLGILSGMIAIALGFLPNARGTDKSPEHIANRIVELSPTDRAKLAELVQQKHEERESAA